MELDALFMESLKKYNDTHGLKQPLNIYVQPLITSMWVPRKICFRNGFFVQFFCGLPPSPFPFLLPMQQNFKAISQLVISFEPWVIPQLKQRDATHTKKEAILIFEDK